jgi:hypothetical protein
MDADVCSRWIAPVRAVLLSSLLGFFSALPAPAHVIYTSYTTLIVKPDTLKLMVVIDEYDLLTSFDLDENGDGMLWREEMLDGVAEVFGFLEERVSVSADGRPLRLTRFKGDVRPDNKGNMFLNLFFKSAVEELPMEVEMEIDLFDAFGADHKNLAKILMPERPLQQAVFTQGNTRQRFVVRERPDSLWGQIVQRIGSWFE